MRKNHEADHARMQAFGKTEGLEVLFMSSREPNKPDCVSCSDSWSTENAVKYYSSHRKTPGDLYTSERYFLSTMISPGCSILDIGCAAGGFYSIFRSIEPSVSYTGVDISAGMITRARELNPGVPFYVSKGSNLPFDAERFDIVFCSGTLHMSPDWRETIREAWRVTKDKFLFDLRITGTSPTIEDISVSFEKIAFFGQWDGKSVVPYIIVSVDDFVAVVNALRPRSALKKVFGYFHPVSPMTHTPVKNVCMTMCCIGKTRTGPETDSWEVPLQMPGPFLRHGNEK